MNTGKPLPAGILAFHAVMFAIYLLPVSLYFPTFGALVGSIVGACFIVLAVRRINNSANCTRQKRPPDAP